MLRLVLRLLPALSAVSAFPQEKRADGIVFEGKPPKLDHDVPLFALGDRVKFPDGRFREILKSAAPSKNLKLKKTEDGSYKYYDGDLLIGLYDNEFGETAVFPNLETLAPGDIKVNLNVVAAWAKDNAVIPADDTKVSIVIGSRLSGAQQKVNQKPGLPGTYLLEGAVRRVIELPGAAHPVCGPGSQASFGFGVDGAIKSLTHRWNPAKREGPLFRALDPDSVTKHIVAQFKAAKVAAGVTVHAVEFCYFDSAAKYLQPVFRFNATVASGTGAGRSRVVGYVPATGAAFEGLPPVLERPGAQEAFPTVASPANASLARRAADDADLAGRQSGPRVLVGRYLMNHDGLTDYFVKEASRFWDGLLSGADGVFVNAQYYWDDPTTYADPTADSYLNAMHLGFSDGHGNHHLSETDGDLPGKGVVFVPNGLASKGYGSGSGGRLVYWILAECSVIPSPFDFAAADAHLAYDPWWPVFNGLRAVVGFRDLASVDPPLMKKAGKWLGQGSSVVHGWMKVMLGAGPTSAVTVCGHAGDHVFLTSGIPRPDCLQTWWYE